MIFLHANMPEEDTHHVAELHSAFQPRNQSFRSHAHTESIGAWGNVPVVVTGSLYGGKPEAGSYHVVAVHGDGVSVAQGISHGRPRRDRKRRSDSPDPPHGCD